MWLPLVDDGILLCEPGAEVSRLVCVQLVLGHLILPFRTVSLARQAEPTCDPFESERYDVGRDGEPEDDGACQRPGIVEEGLVGLALGSPGSHLLHRWAVLAAAGASRRLA